MEKYTSEDTPVRCEECGEAKMTLVEPGVRIHRDLVWRAGVLVVKQRYPIEFEENGDAGECLICSVCGSEAPVPEMEWE